MTKFPHTVSYNRFVGFMPCLFFKIMFMKLYALNKNSDTSSVDSTMIPVRHTT